MFQEVQQIQAFIQEQGLQFVDFKRIDLRGRLRHLSIPVAGFTEDTLQSGIGFDASNYGYAMVENSDMVFLPNIITSVGDPFV